MQHLKRRHKKSIEVQDSITKEAQENSEEIHEVGCQQRNGGAPDSEQYPVWCAPECPVGHQTVCAEGPATRHPWVVAPNCSVCTGQSG
jgi:hypothetical protein